MHPRVRRSSQNGCQHVMEDPLRLDEPQSSPLTFDILDSKAENEDDIEEVEDIEYTQNNLNNPGEITLLLLGRSQATGRNAPCGV